MSKLFQDKKIRLTSQEYLNICNWLKKILLKDKNIKNIKWQDLYKDKLDYGDIDLYINTNYNLNDFFNLIKKILKIEETFINDHTISALVLDPIYKKYRQIDFNIVNMSDNEFLNTYYWYYKKPFFGYFIWIGLKKYLIKYWQYNLRIILDDKDLKEYLKHKLKEKWMNLIDFNIDKEKFIDSLLKYNFVSLFEKYFYNINITNKEFFKILNKFYWWSNLIEDYLKIEKFSDIINVISKFKIFDKEFYKYENLNSDEKKKIKKYNKIKNLFNIISKINFIGSKKEKFILINELNILDLLLKDIINKYYKKLKEKNEQLKNLWYDGNFIYDLKEMKQILKKYYKNRK